MCGVSTSWEANADTTLPNDSALSGDCGVQIAEGAANSLTNYGTIENLNGIGGAAILGDTGDEAVSNFGVVTGSVDLGDESPSHVRDCKWPP